MIEKIAYILMGIAGIITAYYHLDKLYQAKEKRILESNKRTRIAILQPNYPHKGGFSLENHTYKIGIPTEITEKDYRRLNDLHKEYFKFQRIKKF